MNQHAATDYQAALPAPSAAGHRNTMRTNGSHRIGHLNVAPTERTLSVGLGAMLTGLGLVRRGFGGLLMAGVGGALAYRGATGHCHLYDAMGLNTASTLDANDLDRQGVTVVECFLVGKPREELYSLWRKFERLPDIMSHVHSVRTLDERRSEWIVKAPGIGSTEARWEAEITDDQPNERIAWRTLPGSSLTHRGAVSFTDALGDRGTSVRVELEYAPPVGQIGQWIAKLLGASPERQLRDDLRKFKQLMETGEVPTIKGQPHGSCFGVGRLLHR